MHFIDLEGMPILEQLRLEEALLRTSEEEYCLVNQGGSPAIVMGISGKPEELIDEARCRELQVPIIRRFTGGGTVYTDENTLFVTFICNSALRGVAPFPKAILEWSYGLYRPLFKEEFALRENDYVFGEHKFGGNAQYIQKGRFVHHTSFLWDFDVERMELLRLPAKRPSYRGTRPHGEFLCALKPRFGQLPHFKGELERELREVLGMQKRERTEILPLQELPHRKQTVLLTKQL